MQFGIRLVRFSCCCAIFPKIALSSMQYHHDLSSLSASCHYYAISSAILNTSSVQVFVQLVNSYMILNNRMTISDYNTKPVRGDRAILL